jgi:hypothetical protein
MANAIVKEMSHPIEDIAANAGTAALTFDVDVTDYSWFGCGVALTRTAATTLTATPYKSYDGGTTFQQMQSVSIATGVGTESPYSLTKTVAGDNTLAIDIDTNACTDVRIVISTVAGGANDIINAYVCIGKEKQ